MTEPCDKIIPQKIPLVWIKIAVTLAGTSLLVLGIAAVIVPPIHKLARTQNPFLHYEGYVLIIIGAMLTFFHRWVVEKLVWLSHAIHRWVSALLIGSVLGIDAMMHVFSIPHMEGWWLPLFSGASVSAVSGWIQKVRRKRTN